MECEGWNGSSGVPQMYRQDSAADAQKCIHRELIDKHKLGTVIRLGGRGVTPAQADCKR